MLGRAARALGGFCEACLCMGDDVLLERIDGLARRFDALGCSSAEVEEVAAEYDVDLPIAYRRFLEVMGRDAAGLFGGSDIGYPHAIGMAHSARELLRDNASAFQLPADAVVFMFHQGYMFWFLRSDDSTVCEWAESRDGDRAPTVVASSLVEFLEAEAVEIDATPSRRSDRRWTAMWRRKRFLPEDASNLWPKRTPNSDTTPS